METKFLKLALNRVKEVLLPVVALVLVFFLGWKFLLPKVIQLIEFHQQLKKNESQVLALEKKATFLQKQKDGDLFASFDKLEKVLPNEKDVAGLLTSLESLKEHSNLKFDSLDLKAGLLATSGASLAKKQEEEFDFRITLSGPYEELLIFLEKAERTAPITSLEKIDVIFTSGKEEARANLLLKTYYLSLVKERIGIEEPLPPLSSSLKETLAKLLKFEVFPYTTFLPEEKIGKENPFSY